MIRALARFAVRNGVAVNLAAAVVFVAGVVAYLGMPREVFPEFSLRTVRIGVVYPGASAEDVERLITLPLEDELLGLTGLRELSSRSQEGWSQLLLEVEAGRDARAFVEDARAAVDRVKPDLPEEAEEPLVEEVLTEWPVIAVFVYGSATEGELRAVAERYDRELEAIEGVSQVVLSGTREPRVWVEVLPDALERYGLALEEVERALAGRVRSAPLGSLEAESGDFLVRVDAEVQGAPELLDLPVRSFPDGRELRLAQVARVRDAFERTTIRARFNGQPCLHLQVNKSPRGDALEISRAVHEYVEREAAHCPPGVQLGTNSDLSVYIRNRLQVMRESAGVGGLLVLVALVLFLNLRVAGMTALGIPFAFLGGLAGAAALGVSMNMMTMFALIVVLGMVVDDAIVVGENIYRKMEEGVPAVRAAVEGTAEVGKPVIATILTTVAAFVPILMIGGTTGNFMRPLPIVVSLCLAASLLEALLVLPAHLAHWSGRRRPHSASTGRSRWYEPARALYARTLAGALRWRYVTLAAAVLVGAGAAGIAVHKLPFNLFDDFESKVFYVNFRTPPGSSVDATERVGREVEAIALDFPREELESANMLVGVSYVDASQFTVGQNLGQVWVELVEAGSPGRRPTAEIIEDFRRRLDPPPDGVEAVEIDQPQAGPTGKAIDIAVLGPDLATLGQVADELQERLRSFAGVRDVRDSDQAGKREVRVVPNEAGRRLGLGEAVLAAELRTAFEGRTVARFRRGVDEVEVVLKLPEELRGRRSALEALRVSTPAGGRVPLASVADLVEGSSRALITRDDGQRSVRVTADVNKQQGNSAEIVSALQEEYADLDERLPGYALDFKGDHEETEESLAGLEKSIFLALLLIYFILGSLFRSVLQPFVIMFAIPFGGVGMVAGHVLMGRGISLMSLIGLLALSGIVINDSLILVDFVNVERRRGLGLVDALRRAGELRFRPIVLTSITTMLGLSPLTFFASGQARFLQPMAISIFFGIGVATVLILVVVPCTYAILEDLLVLVRRPLATAGRLARDEPVHLPGPGPAGSSP